MARLTITSAQLQSDGRTVLLGCQTRSTAQYKLVVKNVTDTADNIIDNLHDELCFCVRPRLVSAISTSETIIRLVFDLVMNSVGLTTKENYTFSGAGQGLAPISVENVNQINDTTVDLTVDGEMLTGVNNYTVIVEAVKSLTGGVIDSAYDEYTFDGVGTAPQLMYINSINNTTIELVFSEELNPATARIFSNYLITEV